MTVEWNIRPRALYFSASRWVRDVSACGFVSHFHTRICSSFFMLNSHSTLLFSIFFLHYLLLLSFHTGASLEHRRRCPQPTLRLRSRHFPYNYNMVSLIYFEYVLGIARIQYVGILYGFLSFALHVRAYIPDSSYVFWVTAFERYEHHAHCTRKSINLTFRNKMYLL